MAGASVGREGITLFAAMLRQDDAVSAHDLETIMLTETTNRIYESHWLRHADRYLALVRAALEKDPDDLELLELLQAMEAAVAARQNRPLH
jgi:hypothetical protein